MSDALAVVMASFVGPTVPEWLRAALAEGLGSVCLFGSNLTGDDAELRRLTAELHAEGPRVLVAIDEEGGDVTRLDARRGSDVPSPAALGVADDVGLTRAVIAALGRRLRGVGVDLDLAPVADVDVDPRNPVIGVRSFGPDPVVVARQVAAAVEELQAAGVAACVKHFPGHGATRQDSHLALPEVTAPIEVLRARELVPFRAAIAAGVEAVMSGHLRVRALDGAGPASASAAVTALLRDELRFHGVLVTDALDMRGVSPDGAPATAAVAALTAGADLLCLGAGGSESAFRRVVTEIEDAVAAGRLAPERLAEAAGRVRALAARAAALREEVEAGPWTAPPEAAEAARRAVRIDGALPDVRGALVVRFVVGANIAVGAVPWGLEGLEGLTGAEHLDIGQPAVGPGVDALLDRAAGRPLVAVVRDAARTPWVLEALTELARRRPDVVVVELGRPGPDRLPGAAVVVTGGASRASARAAVEALPAGAP